MRGHLGTILTNKSETVIQISSSKDEESIKLVETLATRNKKPENWSFEIIDGNPEIMDVTFEQPTTGRPKARKLNDIERYSLLTSIFSRVKKDVGLGAAVLTEQLKEEHVLIYGNIGVAALKDLVKYCKEMNWIISDGQRSNYFLYPFNLT